MRGRPGFDSPSESSNNALGSSLGISFAALSGGVVENVGGATNNHDSNTQAGHKKYTGRWYLLHLNATFENRLEGCQF